MKQFTTIKVGYTAGVYGCSGEYFTTIFVDGKKHGSISHYGMYGSEERVNRALKDLGYKEFYCPSSYGRMTKKDILKCFLSEREAVDTIKNRLSDFLRDF